MRIGEEFIKMLIGEKIKNLRKNKHLTQEELGKLINTDGNTVSRWERDRLGVGSSYIAKLAEVLNTTTDYLLKGDPEPPEPPAQGTGQNLPINSAPETVNNQSENLGLGYWGSVADNARKVAARGDKREIELVAALLQSAVEAVKGAEQNLSSQIIGIQGNNNVKNNVNIR